MRTGTKARKRPVRSTALRRELAGGPLSRELLTVKLIRLGDYIARAGTALYARSVTLSALEQRVLIWCCEIPPLSINELSSLVHRGAGQVSRTVRAMVEEGLLHRRAVGGGRTVAVTPTAKGRAVYAPMVVLARSRENEVVQGISAQDLRALHGLLDQLLDNAAGLLLAEEDAGVKAARGALSGRRGYRSPVRANPA